MARVCGYRVLTRRKTVEVRLCVAQGFKIFVEDLFKTKTSDHEKNYFIWGSIVICYSG